MSIRAINWAFGSIEDADLHPAAALTLLALAHCHNQETGRCDPSLTTLCAKTGLSERAVRNALRQLEEAKLLATTHRTVRTGRGRRYLRNRYTLRGGAQNAGRVGHRMPQKGKYRAPSAFSDLAMGIEDPSVEDMRFDEDRNVAGD